MSMLENKLSLRCGKQALEIRVQKRWLSSSKWKCSVHLDSTKHNKTMKLLLLERWIGIEVRNRLRSKWSSKHPVHLTQTKRAKRRRNRRSRQMRFQIFMRPEMTKNHKMAKMKTKTARTMMGARRSEELSMAHSVTWMPSNCKEIKSVSNNCKMKKKWDQQ